VRGDPVEKKESLERRNGHEGLDEIDGGVGDRGDDGGSARQGRR
jgi:hypothetical protein